MRKWRKAVSGQIRYLREAGVPFQPPLGDTSGIYPIAEWLSLMEAVQMLCPVRPVRDRPTLGDHWRL